MAEAGNIHCTGRQVISTSGAGSIYPSPGEHPDSLIFRACERAQTAGASDSYLPTAVVQVEARTRQCNNFAGLDQHAAAAACVPPSSRRRPNILGWTKELSNVRPEVVVEHALRLRGALTTAPGGGIYVARVARRTRLLQHQYIARRLGVGVGW